MRRNKRTGEMTRCHNQHDLEVMKKVIGMFPKPQNSDKLAYIVKAYVIPKVDIPEATVLRRLRNNRFAHWGACAEFGLPRIAVESATAYHDNDRKRNLSLFKKNLAAT